MNDNRHDRRSSHDATHGRARNPSEGRTPGTSGSHADDHGRGPFADTRRLAEVDLDQLLADGTLGLN